MKNTILLTAMFLILGVLSAPVRADEAGLYDPVAPDGSAFVRFLNAAEGKAQNIKAKGKSYDALEYRGVSAYFVVPQGPVKASFGSSSHNFEAVAGAFYTLVKTAGLRVLEDDGNDNSAKSQISFYNLSGRDGLSLKTADGKIAIVGAVANGATDSRQINPVKLEMAVYDGETNLKTLDSVTLERGMSYSVIVPGDGEILWVQSRTDTTR